MTTATAKKLSKEIEKLRHEVAVIKAAVLGRERDAEGRYNPKFVREVLRLAKERPLYTYRKGVFTK